MELRLTFPVGGDAGAVNAASLGLSDEDLDLIRREAASADPESRVTVEAGSSGKGVAAVAADIVFFLSEVAFVWGPAAITWADLLRRAIAKVHKSRHVSLQDPRTIGLLAAEAAARGQNLLGASIGEAVCLSGGGPGVGTDARDV